MVPGGEGLGRASDGRIALVSGAFPGDRVAPIEVEEHRSWVRVRSHRLERPSADRVEPPCPVADRCGGCAWMRWSRPAQLAGKESLLRQALERTGGLCELPGIEVVTRGGDLGYRSRIRVHVDHAGRIGYFAAGTRDLVPVTSCAVADPALSTALARLAEMSATRGAALAILESIELRVAPAGPRLVLALEPRRAARGHRSRPAAPPPALLAALAELGEVDVPGARTPIEDQRWPLYDGVELGAEARAFTQVSWEANRELVRRVVAGALARGARRFLDVYAGAGNFALALARAGLSGVAIDTQGGGLRSLERSLLRAGFDASAVRVIVGDAALTLGRTSRAPRYDLAVIDPPRAGAKAALGPLLALEPKTLALVSCDPTTLARDVAVLLSGGYSVVSLTVFDFFPHTPHVETLAWLERQPGDEPRAREATPGSRDVG